MTKAVSISDIHVLYHDKKTHKNLLKFLIKEKPELLVINGDFYDFKALGHFPTEPKQKLTLQDEFDLGRKVLGDYRKAMGNRRIVVTLGNHELRAWRMIVEKPELSTLRLFSPKGMFFADELNLEVLPFRKGFLFKDFIFTHGDESKYAPANPAKKMLDKYGISGTSGHVHHTHYSAKTSRYTGNQEWFVTGTLSDIEANSEDYEKNPDWQQSIFMGRFSDSKFIGGQLITFYNNEVL